MINIDIPKEESELQQILSRKLAYWAACVRDVEEANVRVYDLVRDDMAQARTQLQLVPSEFSWSSPQLPFNRQKRTEHFRSLRCNYPHEFEWVPLFRLAAAALTARGDCALLLFP